MEQLKPTETGSNAGARQAGSCEAEVRARRQVALPVNEHDAILVRRIPKYANSLNPVPEPEP